ncbi:alpha/beta fold hydrolase [Robertmurraya kyonggiensis]|uniref:Alpha/beta hydrolase n=1 Tax=Robertmurraya kyonggiensis TaxID=1037680 RepID=A0A4U1DAG0_9BACI|nr:alpha/beta hydrolase [Robertmurraya kyonggiensis]TKC19512.1 alpha/beta hydrolase [Robertmurraya kyonggiensis]
MPNFLFEETRIYFEDYGTGIPIIFIHPPAMGRKVFHFQAQLSNRFRVILPDLSGHGDSIGPYRDVSINGYAQEIKELIEHLEISKAVVCGYSSGGLIALEFALSFPHQTSAVILASGFPEVKSLALKYEHIMGMYFVKKFPHMLAKLITNSHIRDKSLRNEMYEHMLKTDRKTWFQFYEESLHYSCVERLHLLEFPLCLLYGSRDFATQNIKIFKKKTTFQLAIIKNVAHQIPTKKWEHFNQLIVDFLNEQLNEINETSHN